MIEHSIFYYPYASFTNAQLPLLKVVALYFDKLYILDPVGASWGTIGADPHARDAVKLLHEEKILETITPSEVLSRFEKPIADAIRSDLKDLNFLDLCSSQGEGRWTLALAKVPQEIQQDKAIQHLLGDFARQFVREVGNNREHTDVTPDKVYDEQREGYEGAVEYRYADFPLALGEAIMMNHALFAGILHATATPITDDSFHHQALFLKLRRAVQDPAVHQIQIDRARGRQIKVDLLATALLKSSQLDLPILNPEFPLEKILEYRHEHDDALRQVREKLGRMARSIETEPWDEAFAHELEDKTLPEIADQLDDARKARDAWLEKQCRRNMLQITSVVAGATTAALTIFAAPLTPVVLATAGLSLATGVAIPGLEWLFDWHDGQKTLQENGLHYLLSV